MSRLSTLRHEFVRSLPERLEPGILYVSVEFATAAHLCCCGCGGEVVTPFSRTDWYMIYDGDAVSLRPSIGNWSFECQSHYWIERGRIRWAPRWSKQQIDIGRDYDQRAKDADFAFELDAVAEPRVRPGSPLSRLWQFLLGR